MVQTNQVHAAEKIVKENRVYLLLGGERRFFSCCVVALSSLYDFLEEEESDLEEEEGERQEEQEMSSWTAKEGDLFGLYCGFRLYNNWRLAQI